MTHTYKHPRPAVTVDAIVLSHCDEVLLIQRKSAPFAGSWAFPGGFLEIDETAEDAVARELLEETGLRGIHFHQLHTSSSVHRDPRGRVISIAFVGTTNSASASIQAADDAADARWFPLDSLPELAFDHAALLQIALNRPQI